MTEFCFVESGDPFESADVAFTYALAIDLAERGHEVVLFLVQNGVLAARRDANTNLATTASTPGIEVLVDDFSLRERGIDEAELLDTVTPAQIDHVVDTLARGARVIWH